MLQKHVSTIGSYDLRNESLTIWVKILGPGTSAMLPKNYLNSTKPIFLEVCTFYYVG